MDKASKSEQKKQLDEKKSSVKPPKAKTSTLKRKFFLFLQILLIAAVIALAYGFYQLWQGNQQATTQLQQTQQQADTQYQQQQQALQQQQSSLSKVQQVTAQFTEQQTWQLAKVEHLVNVANLSLQLEKNVSLAISLLQAAEQQLKGKDGSDALAVRQSIAKDLQQLQALPVVDMASDLLALSNLSKQVKQLITNRPDLNQATAQAPSTDAKDQESNKWKQALQNTWQQLRSIIIIQSHDHDVSRQYWPKPRAYLDDHFQMLISQAQWGLLHGNAEVYQQSLQQAISWITENYDGSSDKTKEILDSLNELASAPTEVDLPNLDPTLSLIEKSLQGNEPSATQQDDSTVKKDS